MYSTIESQKKGDNTTNLLLMLFLLSVRKEGESLVGLVLSLSSSSWVVGVVVEVRRVVEGGVTSWYVLRLLT